MTTKPFSQALNDYIINIVTARALATATDWELTSRVWTIIENVDSFSREGHDFDAVLNQVKNLRAAHMGPNASAVGNATAYRRNNVYSATQPAGATPPPGDGAGAGSASGSWRANWSNFTSTFGANARNWGNSARSAWGGAGGASGGSGGGGGGRGAGAGGGGRGRGRWWNWGGGGGGGGGSGRGRSGRRGSGRPGRGSPFAGFGAAMKQSWNKFQAGMQDNPIAPWLFQQFQPGPQGFLGKVGGVAGMARGMAGGAGGMMAGQAVGTIIGNFAEKMKDAVVQAREFGMALKESNRRFIYYNADIAMSYVASDFAEMRRNFSIARAIAPNVASLNQNITTYQQTIMPWDILRTKLSYETKGAGLGAAQYLAEVANPLVSYLGSLLDQISPKGDLGNKLGRQVMRANLHAIYSSIPLIGPFLGFMAGAGMLPGLLPPGKAAAGGGNLGDPIGPWERLVANPNAVPPRDAQFNQMPMRPMGGRNRF